MSIEYTQCWEFLFSSNLIELKYVSLLVDIGWSKIFPLFYTGILNRKYLNHLFIQNKKVVQIFLIQNAKGNIFGQPMSTRRDTYFSSIKLELNKNSQQFHFTKVLTQIPKFAQKRRSAYWNRFWVHKNRFHKFI